MLSTGCLSPSHRLPSSVGDISEILVVATPSCLELPACQKLMEVLRSSVPGLSVDEPQFDIRIISPSAFKGIYHKYHSILLLETTEDSLALSAGFNTWADPQLILRIHVPASGWEDSLYASLCSSVVGVLRVQQGKYLLHRLAKERNTKEEEKIFNACGMRLMVPKGYFLARGNRNFVWIRKETTVSSVGICLVDSLPFRMGKDQWYLRDSLCKLYIKGPSDGSFMVSETDFSPVYTMDTLRKVVVNVMHGWWKMQGDFMGGPYINYWVSGTNGKPGMWADIYVYYPNQPKRDMLLEAEAVLKTIK